jgi:rSAM/selenodomain-associated transferase 1
MARAPSSGGKARLAPHLSEHRLRTLRRALLADTLRTVTNLRPRQRRPSPSETSAPPGGDGGEVVVFVAPGDAADEVRALTDGPIDCMPQVEGDLGRRMRAAFTHLLQTLNCDAGVLVGSDIPLLTADHFDEARETLAATDGVVLGPADDGGYYLIGMRRLYVELFEGVPWGTSTVLTDTLRIAARAGIDARLIRPAYDVDTIEDLRRLEGDLCGAAPDLAPHVRAWLRAG